jgi:hypothetical protein
MSDFLLPVDEYVQREHLLRVKSPLKYQKETIKHLKISNLSNFKVLGRQ